MEERGHARRADSLGSPGTSAEVLIRDSWSRRLVGGQHPPPSHFVDQAFPAKTMASQPIHETDPIRVTNPVPRRVAGSGSILAPLP